jgi:hypothetical protein
MFQRKMAERCFWRSAIFHVNNSRDLRNTFAFTASLDIGMFSFEDPIIE